MSDAAYELGSRIPRIARLSVAASPSARPLDTPHRDGGSVRRGDGGWRKSWHGRP